MSSNARQIYAAFFSVIPMANNASSQITPAPPPSSSAELEQEKGDDGQDGPSEPQGRGPETSLRTALGF